MDEDDTLAGFLEEEEWKALADNILADEMSLLPSVTYFFIY
jgi:hypothetical protein